MEGGRRGYKRATWENLVGMKKRCILAVVDRRTHGTKYTHMHTHTHTRVHICMCTHAHGSTHMHTCAHPTCTLIHAYTHAHPTHSNTCAYMHAHTPVRRSESVAMPEFWFRADTIALEDVTFVGNCVKDMQNFSDLLLTVHEFTIISK